MSSAWKYIQTGEDILKVGCSRAREGLHRFRWRAASSSCNTAKARGFAGQSFKECWSCCCRARLRATSFCLGPRWFGLGPAANLSQKGWCDLQANAPTVVEAYTIHPITVGIAVAASANSIRIGGHHGEVRTPPRKTRRLTAECELLAYHPPLATSDFGSRFILNLETCRKFLSLFGSCLEHVPRTTWRALAFAFAFALTGSPASG